jgi:hypothetical protein
MYRRIIPVLCALVVAVVPATALAQPAQDPSPAADHTGVVYGDTKYDLQNQQDQKSPVGVSGYEKAISGDTKGNLPRAIAPSTAKPDNRVSYVDRVGSLTSQQLAAAYGTTMPKNAAPVQTAAPDDDTNGWQIAAWIEGAVIAALAIGAAVFFVARQHRAPRMGV